MLPVAQAFASDSLIDANLHMSREGAVLAQDGLVGKLLGFDDDDDDNEGGDDDEGEDDDDDDHQGGGGDDDDPGRHDLDAEDSWAETEEDSSVRIELEADEEDSLTFSIEQEPENGKLSGLDESEGTVTYEPDANFFGSDSFIFKVSDDDGESDSAQVTIRVSSVNDSPEALGSQISTTEGKSVSFELKATDVDSDELDYEIVSGPSHGKLTGTAPHLKFDPDRGFDGSDEIVFRVSDGSADSDAASVQIKVKEEKKKDNDESDEWWEKVPVTKQDSEAPPTQPPDENENSTGVAAEPEQPPEPAPVAVAAPIFEIPIARPVLTPQITQEIPAAALGDTMPPQLVLPGSMLKIFAMSADGAAVNYVVKAVDDTDGEIEASCSPSSGTTLPVGSFDVVCRATDAAGNTALNSFVVVVGEASATPVATSPASFVFPALITAALGAGAYFGFKTVMRRLHRYPS
jgi:hypothetical protein